MIYETRIHFAVLVVLILIVSINEQTPPPSKTEPAKSPAIDKDKAFRDEAKRIEEQKRATEHIAIIRTIIEAKPDAGQKKLALVSSRHNTSNIAT